MAENECVCEEIKSEGRASRLILWALLGLIATVAFVAFLVWAILHPHGPRFVLQDVTIYSFSISQPNFFNSNLQVTLSSCNPNDNIGIFYDHVDIYASYRNQKVTLAKLLPAAYQGHLDVTVWSPVLFGTAVPVDPNLSQALNEDIIAGMLVLNIKIDGCVRWKVGSWVSGCYRLLVNCPAYITFSGDVPATKYEFGQQCAVDV